MQNFIRKVWLPMAAFIAIVSLGLILKTTMSSEKLKSVNGIVVDNLVTNHLWCAPSALETVCGACKGKKPPVKAGQNKTLASIYFHSLRTERHRIPT